MILPRIIVVIVLFLFTSSISCLRQGARASADKLQVQVAAYVAILPLDELTKIKQDPTIPGYLSWKRLPTVFAALYI